MHRTTAFDAASHLLLCRGLDHQRTPSDPPKEPGHSPGGRASSPRL